MISPLAYIHPSAKLGEGVEVGPFAYIEENVEIGARTKIMANANVLKGTRIGEDCTIFPGAVVGGIPQDLKYHGEDTLAVIGNRTVIRECATVHRATASKQVTVVGDDCLIMAYCHVAHDCHLGNHIIMSNAVQLAGEVVVEDWAIIGGGSLVHQFTHIGGHVMIQGGSKVNKDIPPYTLIAKEPIQYCGINSVGLSRRGFKEEDIHMIQDCYRIIYQDGLNVSNAVKKVLSDIPECTLRDEIIGFIQASPRGIVRGHLSE